MMFEIPWHCEVVAYNHQQWTLLALGLALTVATFITQMLKPAPYGRFDTGDAKWGPRVPQRAGHMLNDGLWGLIFFLWLYMKKSTSSDPVVLVFVFAWLTHFIQRGFIHPIIAKYSRDSVTLGIPVSGLTLAFFSYLHCDFFASCKYRTEYFTDVRFVIGAALFAVGFTINRWADRTLMKIRAETEVTYQIPRGGLFELVSCPNYFGEFIQWIGWSVATWAPCAFLYCLFTSATFFPRSTHTHHWYIKRFKSYPRSRKSLIPFIF